MKISFCMKGKKTDAVACEQPKPARSEPRFGKDLQPIPSKHAVAV